MHYSLQQQFESFGSLLGLFLIQTFLNNPKCLRGPMLNMLLIQVCCTRAIQNVFMYLIYVFLKIYYLFSFHIQLDKLTFQKMKLPVYK